ncbi:MAG TPA: CvpA family protein [Pseudomonadales bacterium]|nr:CvpA family protein [Pseudomonadales bacterium]
MANFIEQSGYNWADWCIVFVVALSALISIVRGFVKEALSLLVWVLAFMVAFYFSERLAVLLANAVETPSLRYLAAFAILFVCTLIVGSLVNYAISKLVAITGLSGMDRLLGMMFGICRGVLVVLLILIFIPKIAPVQQDPWWQQSKLVPRILVLENWSRETAASVSGWGMQQFEKVRQEKEKQEKQSQEKNRHGM